MRPAPVPVHMAAIGLLRDGPKVLMVESRYPSVSEPFWALPGGLLESGEAIGNSLAREVKEETDLDLIGPIAVVSVIWLRTVDGEPDWVTFVCEPKGWRGEPLPDHDPDGVTTGVAFVPADEAIDRLSALPWGTSDAIIARLRGAPAGAVWQYRWLGSDPFDGNGPAELITESWV